MFTLSMPSKKQKPAPPQSNLRKFAGSKWFFPALLGIVLLLLTVFRLSGTSLGVYHDLFYGKTTDPSLVLNHPQSIRSDEWLVTSQLTIAQHAANYPKFNPNIDNGRDMSVVGDAPYKEWSVLFRPQNLVFFVLPFGFAFALKWWLVLFATIVAWYLLVLKLFPGKRLLAALLGSSVGLSPFLFWWYSSGTFGPMAYGALIILLGINIINGDKFFGKTRVGKYTPALQTVLLGYLLSCFALLLYPPFQIPVALAVAAFLAGYYLQKYGLGKQLIGRESIRKLSVFLGGFIICLAVVIAFIHTRSDVVDTISSTVYPAQRQIDGGGTPMHQILATYLQPRLQTTDPLATGQYYGNQSEASNFILLLPFLFIPGLAALVMEYRQSRKLNWPLLAIQALAGVFFLNLFVKSLSPLYHLLFLNKIPHNRLLIGLGFVGFLQLLLVVQSMQRIKLNHKILYYFAGGYGLLVAAVIAWTAFYTRQHFPLFVHSKPLVGLLALSFIAIVVGFLSRKVLVAAALLLALSIASVAGVHPVYRGLGPLYNGNLTKAIDSVSKPGDSWAAITSIVYENVPLDSNRDSVSGIKPYPDLAYWGKLEGVSNVNIYNRYAHVLFASDLPDNKKLYLAGSDSFHVKFECTDRIKSAVDFVLADHAVDLPCLKQVKTVSYPAVTFSIYKLQ